jgi:hypothetical protein
LYAGAQNRLTFGSIGRIITDKEDSMYTHRRLASAAVLISMTAAVGFAQGITSAHSGLLHYSEGTVTVDGNAVESKVGKFLEIKENSVLQTAQGRAEILLTPGVYLRVGENTGIKMLDNRLMSTRVELLSGTALVESDDPQISVKDPAVTIVYKDYQIQPVKFGIFELTSDPSEMKVYKGQANVVAGTEHSAVHEGQMLTFSAALVTQKFDVKQADDLYLWARDRSGALSAANLASARSLNQSGYSLNNLYMGGMYPGLGFNSGLTGGWYLNQTLGMYAYMPYDGMFMSPWGYGLFSPGTIYNYYSPGGYTWYGGTGARNGSFLPQPVSGSLATLRTGTTSGAPTRLTAGLPVVGSSSGSLALAHGGLSSGLARVSSSEGGRFGGVASSSNSSITSSSTGSAGRASSGSGGFSGGGAGGGGGMGGGGGAHGGGRAR